MNIKRFFTKAVLTMTICSVTVCGLSGCGNKNANVTDDKGRTIVTVGGWPTKEGTEKQNIEERKQKFEADNTDFVIQPDNWAFDLKSFYAKAAGGQLPVLFNTNFTEVSQIINAGYGADLTDELKKQGIYDKMNKDVMDVVSKDGK
ncbi:MAG: hypothetical protein PUJ07_07675, partial [Eubacteriales bacterium]|nr:hypothetical protein [Eubacteriales bacterium]